MQRPGVAECAFVPTCSLWSCLRPRAEDLRCAAVAITRASPVTLRRIRRAMTGFVEEEGWRVRTKLSAKAAMPCLASRE